MEFLRRLYFPLLLLTIFVYAWRPMNGGEDFWAHAAIGRWVLENGHAPQRTLFLWSADIPWIFHAYGTGVIFALLLRTGGPVLAILFNGLMSALPFVLLWRLARRNGSVPALVSFLFLMAVWVSWVRWRLRPELFTATFLTLVYLFVLAKQRRPWHYAGMLLVFVAWPNLHAGVALGIVALWLGVALESLQNRRLDPKLLVTVLLCTIAPFLFNPYGFAYVSVFGGTEAVSHHVTEWRPFWQQPAFAPAYTVLLFIPYCVAVVLWLRNPQRRWAVLGWLILLLLAFLQARRQLWLLSLASMLGIVTASPLLESQRIYAALKRRKDAVLPTLPHRTCQLFVVVMLICTIALSFEVQDKGAAIVPDSEPIQMAEFLATQAPQGRIFNDYEYSAGLEWFLHGRRKLYIDLINAYPPGLFDDYMATLGSKSKWQEFTEKNEIKVVALRPLSGEPGSDVLSDLYSWLQNSPDWKTIYRGKDGRVWARTQSYAE